MAARATAPCTGAVSLPSLLGARGWARWEHLGMQAPSRGGSKGGQWRGGRATSAAPAAGRPTLARHTREGAGGGTRSRRCHDDAVPCASRGA